MKDRLIALGGFLVGLIIIVGIPAFFDQLATGRIFLSWPQGSIWSNMIASAWWVLIASFCVWYFRDHIGKRLAVWWEKHHPQKERLKAMEIKINEAATHALAARHIANDTYKAGNGGQDHPMAVEQAPARADARTTQEP